MECVNHTKRTQYYTRSKIQNVSTGGEKKGFLFPRFEIKIHEKNETRFSIQDDFGISVKHKLLSQNSAVVLVKISNFF